MTEETPSPSLPLHAHLAPIHDQEHEDDPHSRAPFLKIAGLSALQLVVAVAAYALIAPELFRAEAANLWLVAGWVVALGLPMSLFEYLYHRYLLHSAVLPFLGIMHAAHAEHHGLTAVKAPVQPKQPEKLVPVKSEYPVEHEHQEESMTFPLWAPSVFIVLFLVLLALPLKLLFPSQPLVLSTIVAVVLYYSAYELWHAVEHLPWKRFWKPATEHRVFGPLVRHVYSFHLMHHWRPTTNLAVVGFWGWAVWDHLLGTHHRPKRLPVQGGQVNYRDAEMQRPRWPIRVLDRWQPALYKWSRSVERRLLKRG